MNAEPAASKQPKQKIVATDITNLAIDEVSGTYYLNAKIANKLHRYSLKTTSKTAAKEALSKRLADLKEQLVQGVEVSSELTVKQCASTFLDDQKVLRDGGALAPGYIRNLELALNKIWDIYPAAFAATPIRKVTIDALRGPYNKLFASPASATTVNTLRRCLLCIFQVAIDRKAITANLANSLPNKPKHDKARPVPSSDAELTKLLDHITRRESVNPHKHGVRDLIEFICWTGARLDEAGNVEVRDVFLDREHDHANPTITLRVCKGSGGKETRARVLPIIPGAIPLLEKLCMDKNPTDSLLETKECLDTLARACRELNLPKFVHHTFRHVFATRALQATNCDFFTVAHWLGHRDGGKLLAKRYAHLQQEHSQKQAKKINFNFGGKAPAPKPAQTVEIHGVTYTVEQLAALLPANITTLHKAA